MYRKDFFMLENSPICPNMMNDLLISPLIQPHYFPFFAVRSAIVERGAHGLSHCGEGLSGTNSFH